jgi:hypothetical protein
LKRNTSNVFNEKCYVENASQRKRMPERPSSTGDLLRYEFALPFREDKITRKIV